MRVGYARVSTQEQTLDLQTDALQRGGCERIYTDKVSGMKAHKPEFERMMSYLLTGGRYDCNLEAGSTRPLDAGVD